MQDAVIDKLAGNGKGLTLDQLAWLVLESMHDSFIITDPDGSIRYLNHAAECLLGVTFTSAYNRRVNQLLDLRPLPQPDATPHPRPISFDDSDSFNPLSLGGSWLLQQGLNQHLVNVSTSTIHRDQQSNNGVLISIRKLKDLERLIQDDACDLPPPVSVSEFHDRLKKARDTCRSTQWESGLLFISLKLTPVALSQRSSPPLPTARAHAIRKVTDLILSSIRSRDSLCQMSQDEFALLLEGCNLAHATRTALKLIDTVRQTFSYHAAAHYGMDASLCIGVVSVHERSASNPSSIIESAVMACYEARQMGGNSLQVHQPRREHQPSIPILVNH